MFERILLPLDGSPTGEAILPQVRRILHHQDAEVIVLRAVHLPLTLAEGAYGYTSGAVEAEAKSYVQRIADRLLQDGARARGLVRVGPSAEAILEAAAEEKATLVAMSTHGRTGLARWVFGSVTEKVVRSSDVPVLVTRSFRPADGGPPAPAPPEELPLRQILVPIDGSEVSLAILPYVIKVARLFRSQVSLLYVVEGVGRKDSVTAEMKGPLEKLRLAGVPAEPVIQMGDPASAILDTCRRLPADMIALTTHGRSGVPRWTLGSVTEKVLRAASVPLLIVRRFAWVKVGESVRPAIP